MTTTKPFQIPKQLIWRAWKLVKANRGSAGIDDQTIEEIEKDIGGHLYKLWNRLSSGTYFPQPVKAVSIPKKSGGARILGIPTVLDRVAQAAVRLNFEPQVEKDFLDNSYGYRPNRSALDAVAITRTRCMKSAWVLEFDIRRLFDELPHDLLMKAVRHHAQCKWTILYIERWLKSSIKMPNGEVEERSKGTPQGGVISPVLSNLFLHYAFDLWMKRNFPGLEWCRYADDGLVHCRSKESAMELQVRLTERFKECGLEIHPEKTKIIYCRNSNRSESWMHNDFHFLGFHFRVRSCLNPYTGAIFDGFQPGIGRDSLSRMRKEVKILWRSGTMVEHNLQDLANILNPKLRGWLQYYGNFFKSALKPLARYIDFMITAWARRKYKKMRRHRQRSKDWLKQAFQRDPKQFAHWNLFPVC